MTRLVDKCWSIAEIEMKVWDPERQQYGPDWSADFFEVGSLDRDEDLDAYRVEWIEYCIDAAHDWEQSKGDYAMDTPNPNNRVFVTRI